MTSRGGSSRGGEHGSQARSRREVDNSSSDSSDSSGLLAGSQEEGKEKENGGGERSRREVDNSWWKKQVDPEKREQSPPAPERNKSTIRKEIKKHLAGKGLVEREDEEENRFLNLSEEIEVTKETFVNKMSEMQKNLLLMVEHCLDFEKDLVKLKEENRRMSIEIKDLREEIKCLKEDEKKSSSGNADGELIFTNSQHSGQQSVIPGGEVVAKPERCRIVTVSSGSLDSHPSPSKSTLPPTEKEETSDYPGPSITWHRPLSLPNYTPPPRQVHAPSMTRPQVVPSMNHTVGPPLIHGAPVGFQGGHPPAPGQTGPAGPTPPLEEERGATSASVLDFFAKASTQSSTSPHHQMVEASAFTSVPPPHPVAGGRLPPSTLPAPRTLLPPAGLPAHQGGMPQGVTALPISEGLSMGYIPVSLPAIQDVPGMHSVESVEAEQRRGEVAGSGSLSDLSSQLMSKLQVASSSTHKPQPTSQNQAVTLLSPQVFANSSPTAPEPTMASNRASSSPGHHQQAAYQNQMAPPYHNNLNPAQMVEALKYMLETDAHFVQRLHEAYTMSVQRRIQQNGHH